MPIFNPYDYFEKCLVVVAGILFFMYIRKSGKPRRHPRPRLPALAFPALLYLQPLDFLYRQAGVLCNQFNWHVICLHLASIL